MQYIFQARKIAAAGTAGLIPSPELQVDDDHDDGGGFSRMTIAMIMMRMTIEVKMMVVMMNLSFWRILFFSAVTWIVMIKVGGNLFGASIELDISAPI